MKLTLAITVYNRYDLLLESFACVIDDPRIDEILIMDDCSELAYWNKIKELPKFNPKIKVVRQLENRGMSVNKRDAVFHSSNEWVILFDSDNAVASDYLDALYADAFINNEQMGRFIYCPSFAKPQFDYRKFEGEIFGLKSLGVKPDLSDAMCNCLFNTCNYVVNRKTYLEVWQGNPEMKGSDTIWFNYLWLKAGNYFRVVPNLHYLHRVHSGSGFMQDVDYNMKKAEEIKQLIMAL
jgi:glycosyltransferase involved in cell wall biosynthesis